jgi:hypothetical protein
MESKELKTTAPKAGKLRTYMCLKYPRLRIWHTRWEWGFAQTDDARAQEMIEKNSEFGVSIYDVTDLIRRELPLAKDKQLYFAQSPGLVIDHIIFKPVGGATGVSDPIGFFSTSAPSEHMIIQRASVIGKTVWKLSDNMFRAAEDAEKITASRQANAKGRLSSEGVDRGAGR